MTDIHNINIQFVDDGEPEILIISAGSTIVVMGLPFQQCNLELWLMGAIEQALKLKVRRRDVPPAYLASTLRQPQEDT